MSFKIGFNNLPILDQFSEEGFVDLVFKISKLVVENNLYSFHLGASFEGEEVGMDVCVVQGIKAGWSDEMELVQEHVYRKGIQFVRSGIESDRLIAALIKSYGLPQNPVKMVERETFTAIALHQGILDFECEAIKIKIFGKDEDFNLDTEYYESFFNLDLANGFVFWNEKDQDYRQALVSALAA